MTQWLGNLHNPKITSILSTVLQWVSHHKAQGLICTLMGALAALSNTLCSTWVDAKIRSGEKTSNRLGTNQTAETDRETKCHQDINISYWRFDRAYGDLYTSYNVGYGSHYFTLGV